MTNKRSIVTIKNCKINKFYKKKKLSGAIQVVKLTFVYFFKRDFTFKKGFGNHLHDS